ncbi:MAG: polysaccharide deacetylase family protein, partial [Bacteroidales bacterium]
VLKSLSKARIKGSFFLTGNCIRLHGDKVREIIRQGHTLAPHSDRHLLYADWADRTKTLVSRDSVERDVLDNLKEMQRIGVDPSEVTYFMPPYEYSNRETNSWVKNIGLEVVSFTPGTLTNADFTIPSMKSYRTSDEIFAHVEQFERESDNGLNGAILLIHPGVHPERPDPFYKRLDKLIKLLKKRGYTFGVLQ